ncbi:Hypothetical protein FNO222_1633 [Francisella orientalis]|uniref:Uncharacterized protein n=1 Tax=Francisella orientalis TaxID=299583 RepID=A0ABN4H050_9GAMM|nr:hypothetical protein FNO12_1618 [Francisella orientalis FNO12]AKN87685.1 Hypothetical protein FNO24_1620 [Francisella orientalis FNO24]AKN89223.1 Hypothetical protein FNO190_1618 [Francisella orientalis]AKU05982.1 Hypothetical protein FNO01_1618 [Francisella orientalis]QEN20900.1 Hypothetical protein FNO39_1633 [Francisella orientalis]
MMNHIREYPTCTSLHFTKSVYNELGLINMIFIIIFY